MKDSIFNSKSKIAVLVFTCFAITGFSQSKSYWSSGGEMLFSFANISDQGIDESSTLRWAPVINLQGTYNHDIGSKAGFFSGLAVRNVGYIYDGYQERTAVEGEMGNWYKKKFRTYNIAVPLGLKFGNMDGMFIYGGYEVELPFVYKEKTFDQGDKIDSNVDWFSSRVETFQHGFVAGVQFPYGLNVRFKYYMSEFHNQDYTESTGVKPYSGLETHIMYFSLGYNIAWDKK
jgi:hypothetical protein